MDLGIRDIYTGQDDGPMDDIMKDRDMFKPGQNQRLLTRKGDMPNKPGVKVSTKDPLRTRATDGGFKGDPH